MNCPSGSTVYITPQEAYKVHAAMKCRGQRGHARKQHGKSKPRRCEVCGHHHITHEAKR